MEPIPTSPQSSDGSTCCRLCGAPVAPGIERCPSCGLHQATRLARPAVRKLITGVAGIYLVTALLVVLFR